MKSQLLCTFTLFDNYVTVVEDIKRYYNSELIYGKMFVLQNASSIKDIFITYNVQSEKDYLGKTISFHRVKDFNCLYTINALNQLIKDENNGVLDKTYKIDWKQYSNSLILTGETGTRVIQTKLLKIISI